MSLVKGGNLVFSSLTVEIEAKWSFKQLVLSWSLKCYWLSPDGSAEHKGGIEEEELLFLTKCRITLQNLRLSLF